jgi:inosine-uridine nucleoside N-ribohydrolase
MTARKIIIDTDPGIDDAMAIFYALASPELDVIGLTTIFGNAATELCTTNALRLLEIAERRDIPVARGADRPLAMAYRGAADFVHGTDGQGDVFDPMPTSVCDPRTAAQFLVDTVMASPGEITLVPLGPLTNVALAMLLEPRFSSSLAGMVLMGGNAFCSGNASPAAEANILNDPEAADVVFGADCPIVMCGLDITEQTVMTSAQLAELSTIDNPRGRHLARIVPYYHRFYRDRTGLDGIFIHDSATISYLLAPELFTTVSHPVRVDCSPGIGRGKTYPARRVADDESPWAGRRDVTICIGIDAEASVALEFSRLNA